MLTQEQLKAAGLRLLTHLRTRCEDAKKAAGIDPGNVCLAQAYLDVVEEALAFQRIVDLCLELGDKLSVFDPSYAECAETKIFN